MTHEIDSVCTYCGVGCDIVGVVRDNKIEKIYARADGYVSQGKLCIKGRVGFDFVDSRDRVRDVRIKKGFIEKNLQNMPRELKARAKTLKHLDKIWYSSSYEFATSLTAWKLLQIKDKFGKNSFGAIGGARTNCESGFLLQKFVRETMKSPNIDSCARVCHAPSLNGMKSTIGEGAATNPYNDIYKTEFILVIGSNTTEAHPIVANRMIEVSRNKSAKLVVCDVRDIQLGKFATQKIILPYEANLLFLNSLAYVILDEKLYNEEFVDKRCRGFNEYKDSILSDEKANPKYFEDIKGYEDLVWQIPKIAREYANSKSMIFWGLGITEQNDGSYAVMAMVNLALMTGNIGKEGAGLMPLRGQNNVQGACDVGCLPYFTPDYQTPKEEGLKTPEMIEAMISGDLKSMLVVGEDLSHIHPNQNKIDLALENLEFLITQELFMTQIAKKSDIVFGVKSAYEKTGVYVNAMRRLHLSQPLVENNLPDDWEVLRDIENKIFGDFLFDCSEDVWNDTRKALSYRYGGASYQKLIKYRSKGLQWPIARTDTPILHTKSFSTVDGFGYFKYNPYQLRGQIKLIKNQTKTDKFYLTTGRVLVHYNNVAQSGKSKKLMDKYPNDTILASIEDRDKLSNIKFVKLLSKFGESEKLPIKYSKTIKKGTLFCSFHHSKSKINSLFGDESDVNTKTANFKSIEVVVIQ